MILSFWNPVENNPQQGIFIQDQAEAACRLRKDVLFVRVNVLPSKSPVVKKEVIESEFFENKSITINISSVFWKFCFVNPWFLAGTVYRTLSSVYPDFKPDLIHSNVIFPCGLAGYLISKKTGSRLIISEHWSKAGKFLKNPVLGNFARKVYNRNEQIICVSGFLADKIREGTGHKNVIVIPNIVDTEVFSLSPKTSSEKGKIEFTCVASWKPPKRLDLILESVSSFAAKNGSEIILNVVGNGPQAELLKSGDVPGNLTVKWHGYLDKKNIAGILKNTDYFLHASETETFSIVTAEALSTGTPVIVSKAGALPELVHERNGLLAENNADSWLENICEIINRSYDNEEISRENRARFSPSTIGNSINEVWNKVLSGIGKSK
jgi:glycosyltransferase involved in cell wall biosynthesis